MQAQADSRQDPHPDRADSLPHHRRSAACLSVKSGARKLLKNSRGADLDLAREQLSLDLTRYDEGQVTMAQVEASRAAEQEKWIVYYDTQHALEVARLTVLRQTGTLVASLRQ